MEKKGKYQQEVKGNHENRWFIGGKRKVFQHCGEKTPFWIIFSYYFFPAVVLSWFSFSFFIHFHVFFSTCVFVLSSSSFSFFIHSYLFFPWSFFSFVFIFSFHSVSYFFLSPVVFIFIFQSLSFPLFFIQLDYYLILIFFW